MQSPPLLNANPEVGLVWCRALPIRTTQRRRYLDGCEYMRVLTHRPAPANMRDFPITGSGQIYKIFMLR